MEGDRIEDVSMSAADVMSAKDSHGMVDLPGYRPMRGQAYVRIIPERSSLIIHADAKPQDCKSYRGRVLALGKPARLTDHPDAPEVPWDVQVGDEVLFSLFVWMDRMRVLSTDEGKVVVVAQGEVLACRE